MSDAPVLTSGTYTMSILTGETQVVGVDLDWGQRLEVEAVIPPRRGALAREVDYFDKMEVQLLGPTRGLHQPSGTKISGKPAWQELLVSPDDKSHRVGAATPPVRYLNRTLAGVENAALPGRHYAAVNYSLDDKEYLLPYLLVIRVVGKAGGGAPPYQAASPTPTPSPGTTTPSPEPSSSASSAAPPADERGTDGNTTMALTAAAAGVIVGAGAVALLLRRRSRR